MTDSPASPAQAAPTHTFTQLSYPPTDAPPTEKYSIKRFTFHSRHFDWAVSCNMQFMSSLEKGRHKASRVGLIPGTEERRGCFQCIWFEKSIAESPLCCCSQTYPTPLLSPLHAWSLNLGYLGGGRIGDIAKEIDIAFCCSSSPISAGHRPGIGPLNRGLQMEQRHTEPAWYLEEIEF